MRVLFLSFSMVAILSACGGAEPRAEASWETHTTAPDDEGGEDVAPEDDPSEDDPEAP